MYVNVVLAMGWNIIKMLYNHQQKFVDGDHERHLLAWPCGSGKSLAAMAACLKAGGSSLIVCPKPLVDNWPTEVSNAIGECFKGEVLGIESGILSKENFKKQLRTIPRHDNLILDEGHYFAGHKSQLFKSALWYIKNRKPKRVYILTATPYLSTPFNIMCYGQLLGKTIGWGWWDFKNKFFDDIRMGNRTVPVPKKGMEKEIAKLVASLGSTYSMEDLFDIPEQIFQREYFDISTEQKKTIKEIIDVLPVVRFTKIHQIESGTLKRDYMDDLELPCEKTSRVIELCGEHKKIAIVARYNAQLSMYKRLLHEKFPGRTIYLINGKNDHRQEDVDKINSDDDAIVLINAACSEGYNLWSVPVMIFASMNFSFKDTEQLKGRILRANKLKKNLYIFLLTKDKTSVDQGVYQSYLEKRDFDAEIFQREIVLKH